MLLSLVQAGVRDLPTVVLNISLGVIGSLVYAIGALLLVSIIDAAGQAGLPFATSIIDKLRRRHGGENE
jgi:hypothetical protein